MKASLRTSLATLAGSAAFLFASAALAVGEPCFDDTDCPGGGGDVCGGDVCKWGTMHAMPDGKKVYICQAAGMDPKGSDGWCTSTNGDANCKCRAQGAKCVGVYCTFTKPDQAPAGTSGSGAGGGSGTAGSGTAGSGTAGSNTAGTGTAGSAAKPAADEGGCSVSAPGGSNTGLALGVGLLGLGLALARRRRSA